MVDQPDVLGRRIAAGLLDLLALLITLIVVGLVFGKGSGSSASVNLAGVSAWVFIALAVAYYWIPEAVSGQTLGKRLLGIRVRWADGSDLGTLAAGVRTLLRPIDALPLLYLLGLLVILATGETRRQRLGDVAARSSVGPA